MSIRIITKNGAILGYQAIAGAGGSGLSVYIKADQRSTHGVVMNILDTVKAGGISSVSFAIDPPKE